MNDFRSHAELVMDAAAAAGQDVLITDDHRSISGLDFVADVQRLARDLRQRGYGRGCTVGIAAGITIDALAVRYAACLAGCTTVFCPEPRNRFGAFVAMARPDVVIVRPELAVRVPRTVRRLVLGHGGELDQRGARSAAVAVADAFAERARPDDIAVLVSSGGTTGHPKASRRTFAGYLGLVSAAPQPGRRQLICTPLAYVAQVLADQTLLVGGRLFLQPGFEPAAVLAAIERHGITHLGLVEPLVARLVDHPDLPRRDLSSLVAMTHIGANAPAALRRRWLEALGPVLVNPYGSSECGIATALSTVGCDPNDDQVLGSAGRPLPGAEIRVERSDHSPAPAGDVGRLVVRTAGAAVGYQGRPDLDVAFRPDGWFASGDLGSLDGDGFLTVRGRAADERVIAGRSLMPVDLETALYAHPSVRYAAALPLDGDPLLPFGAVVTSAPGSRVTAAELSRWVTRRDPALAPVALALTDVVPVTDQGKPDRAAIADLLQIRARAA